MLYRVLVDLIVVLHLGFVLFAVLGAFLVARWPRVAWLHVPAVVWAALIEFAGWVCPLTPLENRLRLLAGESGYHGGFTEHYLLRILYPNGLTRAVEIVLGALVLGINLVVYGWVLSRRVKRRSLEAESRGRASS